MNEIRKTSRYLLERQKGEWQRRLRASGGWIARPLLDFIRDPFVRDGYKSCEPDQGDACRLRAAPWWTDQFRALLYVHTRPGTDRRYIYIYMLINVDGKCWARLGTSSRLRSRRNSRALDIWRFAAFRRRIGGTNAMRRLSPSNVRMSHISQYEENERGVQQTRGSHLQDQSSNREMDDLHQSRRFLLPNWR